jgi:hypothetical protein
MTPVQKAGIPFLLLTVALIITAGCIEEPESVDINQSRILGEATGTGIVEEGSIMIDGIGKFGFLPADIQTVRPDIFREDHFSVFDILVFLNDTGRIELDYHFDESLNTHVVDGINGGGGWWYMAYYDGGWPEANVFRMDHYPYKDRMYIRILREDPAIIERKYAAFQDEVARRKNHETLIIPEVVIRGPTTDHTFTGVEVTAHDLRADIFQSGTITAADTILSLGDQGQLTYDLRWYDSIGSAEIVKSYYVDRIDADAASFRCGFVYEAGSTEFRGGRGNHIHLPSDTRVLNAPEYEEFFWICL